jgi:hypothetical protein
MHLNCFLLLFQGLVSFEDVLQLAIGRNVAVYLIQVVYTYVYIYIHMYKYTLVNKYICVYIYIYIYIYECNIIISETADVYPRN